MLKDTDREVATFLNRKFSGLISTIETLPKEDLDLVSFHAATFNLLYLTHTARAEFILHAHFTP